MNEVTSTETEEILDRLELATVKRVKALEPIPGKDRVELVHLEDCGFTTVCEKIHSIGDLVVFIKYDTIVPAVPLFDFMAQTKYRVKPKCFTVKDEEDEIVGKLYSQGIVLPLKEVMEHLKVDINTLDQFREAVDTYKEGLDLTEALGIKKYIPPVSGGGGSQLGVMKSAGDFPTDKVSKTDELNLASKTRLLEELQGKTVYLTLKIEGSSSTDMLDDDKNLMVCSRNNIVVEHETNKFWQAANKYNLKEQLQKFPELILQGEVYGSGIQKNKLGIEGVDLAVFNMFDRERNLMPLQAMEYYAHEMGLKLVPIVAVIENFDWTFDQLQAFADKQVYANGEAAEGIVVRPVIPFRSKVLRGDWWSCKVINRDYRL